VDLQVQQQYTELNEVVVDSTRQIPTPLDGGVFGEDHIFSFKNPLRILCEVLAWFFQKKFFGSYLVSSCYLNQLLRTKRLLSAFPVRSRFLRDSMADKASLRFVLQLNKPHFKVMNLQIELKNVSEELDMVKNEMEDSNLYVDIIRSFGVWYGRRPLTDCRGWVFLKVESEIASQHAQVHSSEARISHCRKSPQQSPTLRPLSRWRRSRSQAVPVLVVKT